MEFVFVFRFSPRWFRKSFFTFTPTSIISLPGSADVQPSDWASQRKASNLRRGVLRRDHYRCRGCDRDEREVTLAVHPVHPDAEDEQNMLTLCRGCFAIVDETKISATHTPDFLRKLWTILHAPSSRS
jgi:hypothetical protein